MNYFGKFDASLSDAVSPHGSGHVHTETVHASHVPTGAIVVPDAHFLFGAEFKRTGVDLVLSNDGQEVVLHDYFKGEKRAALASPDGAHLTGDIVTALAGQVQYAQAAGNAGGGQVIGHVTKLVGSATAIRNGVSIILNNGDNVEKGDVVQSGSDSTLGITFIDGTVFGLASNARMVLNEMVYDPNGSNNSSLLSLVAGTITFVAGETAKHGDMKVDTPVATMGIRGTAVLVEIDFSVPGTTPDARFQVLVEPDGTTGSYILFDKTTLTPLAVVDRAGTQINISNGIMSQTLAPLSPEIQKLITDVFSLKFSDNSNTKSIEHFTDSIVPIGLTSTQFALVTGAPIVPVFIQTAVIPNTPNSAPPPIVPHFAIPPTVDPSSVVLVRPAGTGNTTLNTVKGTISFVDDNAGDRPTVSAQFVSLTLTNAKGQDITASLTGPQLAALEAALTIVQDPAHTNHGTATYSYNIADFAFALFAAGDTLTLTYNAIVNNNFLPLEQTATLPFTVTIVGSNSTEIWSETTTSNSSHPGDWNDGENWQSGTVPTAGDDVIIGSSEPQSTTPFYPVTIKSVADGGVAAVAYSVTMAGSGQTKAELDNYNTLTIGNGGLTLNADSTVKNFGTISAYSVTLTGASNATTELDNHDTLTIGQGGLSLNANSTLKNFGTITALSVTMDDSGTNKPELDNYDTLTVGSGGLTLSADSILKNFGSISIGGLAEILQESVLNNSGTLTLEQGGDFLDQSSITNCGTIDLINGILNVEVDIANIGGTIAIGKGSTLNMVSATINGGTIDDTGTLLVTASSEIDNATVNGGGDLTVAGGATLTLELVTLDDVTLSGSFNNLAGLTIDDTVTLDGATINGATINDTGTLSVTASSEIENATVSGGGKLTVAGGKTLTLDTVILDGVTLSGSFGNAGTLTIIGTVTLNGATLNGGTIDDFGTDLGTLLVTAPSKIENATVDGGGKLTVASGTALTLDTVTLDNVTLTGVDNSSTLTIDNKVILSGATLNGGTIDDAGTLSVTASSEIENATVNGGGDLTVASGAMLTLESVTLDDVTLSGSFNNLGVLTIDDTVTLAGGTITGGTINDTGTLSVTVSSEIESLLVDGGGNLAVAGGATLTLDTVILDGVTLSGSFSNANMLTIIGTVTLNGATLNGGTIDDFGTDLGTLLVTAPSEIENATVDGGGKLTVANGATLTLDTVTLDNVTLSGSFSNVGTLTTKDTVTLNGGSINGGTLDILGVLDSTGTTAISGATIVNPGNIDVLSGTLTIDPSPLTNTGAIEVHGNAGLVLSDEVVTNSVTGGGKTANGIIQVDHNGTLTLEDTSISGGIVENFGTIDVTAGSSISDTFSFVNAGTVTADGAALTLSNTTIDNTFGTLTTIGKGVLDLVNATVNRGKLAGNIETAAGNTVSTLNGVGLGFGTLVTAAVGVLELTGTIFNNGEIDATTGTVHLDNTDIIGGTFGGSGTIATAAGNFDSILSGVTIDSGSTVTAAVGILDLTGTITNGGTIDATTSGKLLFDNATVIGGTLGGSGQISTGLFNFFGSVLDNVTVAAGTNVTASSGTLELTGMITNGGEIDATTGKLELNDATIVGGTLGGDGLIFTVGDSNELSSVTIAKGATIDVSDGTTLDLVGTITDHGTIALNSYGHGTELQISGNVSLAGGGSVAMTDSSHNFIVSDGSSATLTNYDAISGAGTIGDSHLTLVNDGTIDATGSHALVIDTGANQVQNNGTLEASTGSTLLIEGDLQNDGVIKADASSIQSTTHVDIIGNVTGTGSIDIYGHATVEIGGSVSSGQTVDFLSQNGAGELILDDPQDFHGVVYGLLEATRGHSESDENYIDLKGFADTWETKVASAVFNSSTDVTAVTITNGTSSLTIDLHGDYSQRDIEFASDHNGGTLLSDPAANSGAVTIDSGTTLDIASASSATITFTNSTGNTGELVLADSKGFTGTIVGLAGDGTTANSDLIDLTDVNISDVATNKTTYTQDGPDEGTLTLYNSHGQAIDSINFDGHYQLANFTVENDGDGGVLIVDPPVNSGIQTPGNTTVASNQNSSATEGYVFNFAGFNHPPAGDFHPAWDPFHVGGPTSSNTQTASNSAPGQDHFNAPTGSDGHDHNDLTGIAKAHLHIADFHFV